MIYNVKYNLKFLNFFLKILYFNFNIKSQLNFSFIKKYRSKINSNGFKFIKPGQTVFTFHSDKN